MRISHRHKFVFLANPRCGSTSIREVLNPFSDIRSGKEFPYHHHAHVSTLRPHFEEQGWDWDAYTVFSTIRNPWDRVVSCWSFGKKEPRSIWHELQKECATDFDRFAMSYFFSLPIDFRFEQDGVRRVDRLIRLDDVDTELGPFLAGLGVEIGEVPQLNSTTRASYQAYFSDEARDFIADLFATDIAEGGYTY